MVQNTTIMEKAEFVNDELGYLAEETSKQHVEGLAWFLLLLLLLYY